MPLAATVGDEPRPALLQSDLLGPTLHLLSVKDGGTLPPRRRWASGVSGTRCNGHLCLPVLRGCRVQRTSRTARASRRRAGFDDQTAGSTTPHRMTIATKATRASAHWLAAKRLPMESPAAQANRGRFTERGQPRRLPLCDRSPASGRRPNPGPGKSSMPMAVNLHHQVRPILCRDSALDAVTRRARSSSYDTGAAHVSRVASPDRDIIAGRVSHPHCQPQLRLITRLWELPRDAMPNSN